MEIKKIKGIDTLIFNYPNRADNAIGEFLKINNDYHFVTLDGCKVGLTSDNLRFIADHIDKLNKE